MTIKKIILVVTLVLSVGVANAQMNWMARVGANVSGIENSDSQMKLGWKAGAGFATLGKTTAGNLHNINYSLIFRYKF